MSLAFEGVTKAWDGTNALSSLSLEVGSGELVTVLGPSGSGKSTALRVAAGLETPDAGVVRIGGRDVTATPPSERGVAMVFQSFALFPHLSARDNIAFGLRARGMSRDDAGRRARELAGPLGLDGLLGRRPAQLSGGERQRVALARALAGRPEVLLLDEPLSNLDARAAPADARLRAEARAEIRRVHAATGITALYVTHDQDEALALGERVAVLNRGQLQQIGTPDEVYDRPANRFVASFVGEPPMNLVEAGRLDLPGTTHDGVLVGFRPEDVVVEPSAPLRARLVLAERTGHDELWHLDAHGVAIVARPRPAREGGPGAPREGDEIAFRVDPAGIRLFDAATGRAR